MVLLERLLYLIIVLGTLVFIHEFGHFLAAKLFGVRVEVFSLGFGPRLAGFRKGDTDYRLAAVPLGGYVKMAGEYPGEESGVEDAGFFNAKPRWQRLTVMFAGPAMNVLLAVALWWVVFVHGGMEPDLPKGAPVVETVQAGSPAAEAGIEAGDKLLSLDGVELDSIQRYWKELIFRPGRTVDYVIERGGGKLVKRVKIGEVPLQGVGYDGIRVGSLIVIHDVLDGSQAKAAGFRPGDRIAAIDGRPPATIDALVDYIRRKGGQPIVFQLVRDGERVEQTVVPEQGDDGIARIGANLSYPFHWVQYPPGEALNKAIAEAGENVQLLFRTLGSLVRRELSVEVLSGPLEIARISQDQAQYGLIPFLRLLAFISINLGIFNLLPIPVLDGGNIMILLIESSIRRDLSPRIKERVIQAGFLLLLVFAVMVVSLDVRKAWLAGSASDASPRETENETSPLSAEAEGGTGEDPGLSPEVAEKDGADASESDEGEDGASSEAPEAKPRDSTGLFGPCSERLSRVPWRCCGLAADRQLANGEAWLERDSWRGMKAA